MSVSIDIRFLFRSQIISIRMASSFLFDDVAVEVTCVNDEDDHLILLAWDVYNFLGLRVGSR